LGARVVQVWHLSEEISATVVPQARKQFNVTCIRRCLLVG
jgi:hypothetical protein